MRIGLRAKVSFIYTLIIALTIGVTYLGVDFVVKDTFGTYLEQRIKADKQAIIDALPEAYNAENGWNSAAVIKLTESAQKIGMSLLVSDNFGSYIAGSNGKGMGMMRGRMMGLYQSPYTTSETLPILSGGIEVGKAEISYQNIFLTETDAEFLQKFNRFLLILGIALGVLAIFMGIIFADSISRPLIRVLGMAERLAKGDYSARILVKLLASTME
jgi:methyl-accepting chemotaxis protein